MTHGHHALRAAPAAVRVAPAQPRRHLPRLVRGAGQDKPAAKRAAGEVFQSAGRHGANRVGGGKPVAAYRPATAGSKPLPVRRPSGSIVGMSLRNHVDRRWFLHTLIALCVLASLALAVRYWSGCGLRPMEPVVVVR